MHHPLICLLARSKLVRRAPLSVASPASLAVDLCSDGSSRSHPHPSTPHSPAGPYDAYQHLPTRPSRAVLRQLADRPGLPPPVLLVACICQPCFMLDRPWAPLPSEASPRSRRPGHTPLAEASRPRLGLSPLPFPISHRACGEADTAVTCRGSEDSSSTAMVRRAETRLALGYPNGCVLRRQRCSRPRRVAPLLVVSPLRG